MDIAYYEPQKQQWAKVLLLEAILTRNIPVEKAAEVLGIPRSSAYRLLKAFRQHGEDSIFDRRFGPRESTLDKLKEKQGRNEQRPSNVQEETESCHR